MYCPNLGVLVRNCGNRLHQNPRRGTVQRSHLAFVTIVLSQITLQFMKAWSRSTFFIITKFTNTIQLA
jgi:hypothetical protein